MVFDWTYWFYIYAFYSCWNQVITTRASTPGVTKVHGNTDGLHISDYQSYGGGIACRPGVPLVQVEYIIQDQLAWVLFCGGAMHAGRASRSEMWEKGKKTKDLNKKHFNEIVWTHGGTSLKKLTNGPKIFDGSNRHNRKSYWTSSAFNSFLIFRAKQDGQLLGVVPQLVD